MKRTAISRVLRLAVRERARHICEYCRFPEEFSEVPFVIDHIVAHQHRGPTMLENLALCCAFCNSHKGPNAAGVDLATGGVIPLFNPRKDVWSDHFHWNEGLVVARTSIGEATIHVLALNHSDQVSIRRALAFDGKLKLE